MLLFLLKVELTTQAFAACALARKSHRRFALLLHQVEEKHEILPRRSHERRHVLIVCFLLSLRSPVSIGTTGAQALESALNLAMKPVRICVTFTHTIRIRCRREPILIDARSRALCADD